MASLTTYIAHPGPQHSTNRLFALLERMAQLSPGYREIMRYNAMSDEDLAAQGMTRADVPERVFGNRMGY